MTTARPRLFAHCASLSVNVVKEPWNRRPDALQHGDQLARDVNLDMAAAGWAPTVENYLGRVPKVRIIEAVREAKGEKSARLIEHLKKTEMAKEAERMLAGAGWLPEPLRLGPFDVATDAPVGELGEVEALPDFLAEDEGDGQDGGRGRTARRRRVNFPPGGKTARRSPLSTSDKEPGHRAGLFHL